MMECRLLEEGGRRHFMTRRFDRLDDGGKLHMQSLAAMAHLDFNDPLANSYEHAFDAIRRLRLPMTALEQQFQRMLFNVVARNQDDHVKNIAFLMDKAGRWSLAPAFDVTYAFNPQGLWTSKHQMSLNGKRDDFTLEDIRACAATAGLIRGRAESMLEQVQDAVSGWRRFADEAGVAPASRDAIQSTFRRFDGYFACSGSATESSSTSCPSSFSTLTWMASGFTFTYLRMTSSSSLRSRGR